MIVINNSADCLKNYPTVFEFIEVKKEISRNYFYKRDRKDILIKFPHHSDMTKTAIDFLLLRNKASRGILNRIESF